MRTGRGHDAGRSAGDIDQLVARAGAAAAWVSDGRHAAAERVWCELAAALARRGAMAESTMVQLARARHLLERGRALEAERVCAEAVRRAHEGAVRVAGESARVWQALALTDLNRLTAAEALCRDVLGRTDLAAVDRSRATAALVRVLLWQTRLDEAAAVAGDIEREGPDAFIDATLVRLYLCRGDVFAAGRRAHAAPHDASGASVPAIVRATTMLRLCAAVGDAAGMLERCARIRALAAAAHLPLRALRAQVICLQGLSRAGHPEATRLAARLTRFERRVPPLLAQAIAEARGRPAPVRIAMTRTYAASSAGGSPEPQLACRQATAIVEAERIADDRAALAAVLGRVTDAIDAARAELWVQSGSTRHLAESVGGGAATSVACAAIERGAAVIGEGSGQHREVGVPIRDGDQLVGALAARVPSGRTDTAMTVLGYAAVVIAPRLLNVLPVPECEVARLMPELVGMSAALEELRRSVVKAAAAPFAVLIEGESGVGKELVARALHRLGPRQGGPFRDLNCAAVPEELLDSELFGHSRGAFTGALADRRGLIEDADGGTLFLDEVADLSPRGQAKLLRVLQEREVRRVGEARARPVDVRVVSAANRDMRALAGSGLFRPDLLYRLDVIRLRIPPLRARPEDVAPLAAHFWADASARVGTTARLTRDVLAALAAHRWPGNVRELQNVVAALAVAAPVRGEVRLAHLSLEGEGLPPPPTLAGARAQFERGMVRDALARAGGNRAQAARTLGVTRQGLAKLMARLGIDRPVTA